MSQIQTKTKVVSGVTYSVRHLSPDDALDIAVDLGKCFGGGLAAAAQRIGLGKGDVDLEDVAIGPAIEAVIAAADKVTYRRIVEMMMSVTSATLPDGTTIPMVVDGHPAWKLHFQGKLGALISVTAFAVGVNFSDFFGGIGRIRTWATGLRAAASPTPGAPS